MKKNIFVLNNILNSSKIRYKFLINGQEFISYFIYTFYIFLVMQILSPDQILKSNSYLLH